MITKILIKGFQRHKKISLRLGQGVNTIIGRSNSGKSSVLRALRWLCDNTPRGNKFIHRGSKKASVTIWVDGHKIKRTKGEGVNSYSIDGHVLKAFGAKPPAEVTKL